MLVLNNVQSHKLAAVSGQHILIYIYIYFIQGVYRKYGQWSEQQVWAVECTASVGSGVYRKCWQWCVQEVG